MESETIIKALHYTSKGVVILNLGLIPGACIFLKRKDVTVVDALRSGYRNPHYYFRAEFAAYSRPLLALTIAAVFVMVLTSFWL